MAGSGHTASEERGAEKLMDDYLKSIGYHRKKIAKDGSCLFRAVAEQVLHCQSRHTEVRIKCVEFLKQNRESYEAFIEGDFEQYLCDLQDPQQWVGEVEINALATIYKRDFLIYQDPGKPPVNITGNNFKDKVLLCFLNGNHYDSIYPISHIKSTAMCQSILYEILYNNVFKVDRSSLGLCQRIGRPTDLLSDDCMAACASSDGSDLDTDEPLWVENGTSTSSTRHQSYRGRGRGHPLPERVRRSLNPTLLRNVALDIWHESKRAQQKMDYCIAAGMQYTVGDRCQVRLEGSGRNYNATVKEAPPTDNLVRVHIEELGDRHVPVWSLRPPADEKSWSTVANKEKRLSNGNGDLEERGRGRGRGKPAPAPSSQAAAPGSSGRVQKQHSWPQQATVDEQGGAKPSRSGKSGSLSESVPFGLTEEERLAKEEEERNVALVEIQLRDEHSFPALGTGSQGDGGRKKGTEKRRSQRKQTKSPEEDNRAASPPAGEKPTATPTSPSLTTAVTTTPPNPHLPAASPSSPCSSTNTTAAPSGSAPALTTKTNAPSQTSAAGLMSSVAHAAPPSTKASVTGGALSQSVPCSATVFSFLTPVLPTASPAVSSSSSVPPKLNASPPPPSSIPPPTFIAPIAPSPAHGLIPPSSLQRSSPPFSSLPHSPSPPPSTSSSSSLNSHAAQVCEPQAQAANKKSDPSPSSGGSVVTSETSLTRGEVQTQPCLPKSQTQSQASLTQNQMQKEDQSLIAPQNQPQPLTEVPQAQMPVPPQTSLPHHSSSQADTAHNQPSSPHPGTSYPQASLPVSSSPHLHPGQPPHPSQLPHPSLCISASPTHPSLQTQNRTETPQPPPQPEAPAHPPSHLTHHPHLPSAPHPQSIPGAVPIQNLSQLYQDPLYPGFPLGEKGDIALTPSYSSSKSGNDLPQDVNILRFFFNMGVKAYSMPMFPPYIYLLPLQQAYALQPKLPSRSPSPHFPPDNAPIRHQEAYPLNPPISVPALPVYSPQAALAEPPRPSEPSLNPAGYPVSQPPPQRVPCTSLPWQQHQMPPPANSTYPVGYPSSAPPYQLPPSSQGYHPGQGTGHPLYPSPMPPYPPSSLGYQSSSNSDKLQVPQGAMEQLQPANGDALSGPGPLHVPAVANANSRTMMVSCVNNFALKKEQGESLTRTVLLVDPPLNNTPILALVSNSDDPVSMTTMKHSSTPGSPLPYGIISKTTVPNDTTLGYQVNPKHFNHNKVFGKLGAPEPAKVGHLQAVPVTDSLSVGCSTEDDWEERDGFRAATLNPRGSKKTYRGGRGRGGGYDGGSRGGHRRRHGGEGFNHVQFSPSYRGRGW